MVYKLLECSSNIPSGFITPIKPLKMGSIAFIEKLYEEAIFSEFTGITAHSFLTNLNVHTI